MKGFVSNWLGVALLCFALCAQGQSQGVNPVTTHQLVIIGASYAADWKQPSLPGYAVINKGVGGEETQQMLARFDRDVIAARPRAVLIWGFINNIHRAPPDGMPAAKERARANYREMVGKARAAGMDVVLATEITLSEAVGIVDRMAALVGRMMGKRSYAAGINEHVRDVNAWIRTFAAQERLQLLDFEKLVDDGRGFRKVEYSSEDGSHISAAGYAALTSYTQSRLKAG